MKVYVVLGSSGTCPSDSDDWLERIYATREAAERYATAHDAGKNTRGGPWFTVEERDLLDTDGSEARE